MTLRPCLRLARFATSLRTMAVLLLAVSVGLPAVARAQASPERVLRGIGIEERLSDPSVTMAALDRAKISTKELPVFVRLIVEHAAIAADRGDARWTALDERLAAFDRLAIPIVLAIEDAAIAADAAPRWRDLARDVARRYATRVAAYQVEVPAGAARPSARDYAFILRTAAVAMRAVDPRARIAQASVGPDDVVWQRALFAEDTDAFVDIVAVRAPDSDVASTISALAPLRSLIRAQDPTAMVISTALRVAGRDTAASSRWLTVAFSQLGEPMVLFTLAAVTDDLAAALTTANSLKDVFAGELIALDAPAARVAFSQDGRDVTREIGHRLLYSLSNFSTYLTYWGDAKGPVNVSLVDQTARSPVVRDPIRRVVEPATGFQWTPESKISRFVVPAPVTPRVVDFNYGAEAVLGTSTEAASTALPSVAEVVFRHQQAQARQDALYQHYSASARMEQHFRATPTEAFLVVSENRFFFSRDSIEWEEVGFTVNGAQWGPDRPPFPLLQAEKVLSLPLDLRLTADYRYEWQGVDEVDGRRAFVVSFEPVAEAASQYRGRIWIDAERYVRLRLNTIQTRLSGLIVSSEEVHRYRQVAVVQGEPLVLPVRIDTTQQVLIAGQNLLLEKAVTFTDHVIDGADFESRRAAARASDRIMFRETPAGLRYLVKRDGERVVSDRMTMSSRALAMGTTIDPSFDFPLPIFGLNYLNFSVRGSDSQFALLFGGVLALGNLQVPRLGRTPFDASVDFFGIGVPGNSNVFDANGERRGERVLTIPASAGANLGYQMSPFQKIRFGYQFRFDAYFADTETATDFAVPSDGVTHGVTGEYRFTRRGYTATAAAGLFARRGWTPWGLPGQFDPATDSYRRYSATVSKDFFLTTFQTLRASVAWYGGRQLDRFSMYQFGLFDEVRMHGVPAAGVRFPELILARAAYSFNIFDIYRVDLFFDRAGGRDPDDRATWHPITGTGIAVNLRAPWHTMFRADVGKSFVPERYAGAGSWAVQLMLLKPLR
jgi:hypothetical protein